jgi:hypothetical protein
LGSIRPNLILDLDDTAMLDVPVRAVGVYGNTDCAGGTADGLNGTPAPIFGGFYVDESLPEGTGDAPHRPDAVLDAADRRQRPVRQDEPRGGRESHPHRRPA